MSAIVVRPTTRPEQRSPWKRPLGRASPDASDVNVERRVLELRPTPVLVEESRAADPLAVGSRRRGGLAELLLGSGATSAPITRSARS
jgi:nucleotide-binding universal stress UspA family protein